MFTSSQSAAAADKVDPLREVDPKKVDELVHDSAGIATTAMDLINKCQRDRALRKKTAELEAHKAIEELRALDAEHHLQQDVVWEELEALKDDEDLKVRRIAGIGESINELAQERAALLDNADFARREVKAAEEALLDNERLLAAVRFERGAELADLDVLRKNLEDKIDMCKELQIIIDEKEWRAELIKTMPPELVELQSEFHSPTKSGGKGKGAAAAAAAASSSLSPKGFTDAEWVASPLSPLSPVPQSVSKEELDRRYQSRASALIAKATSSLVIGKDGEAEQPPLASASSSSMGQQKQQEQDAVMLARIADLETTVRKLRQKCGVLSQLNSKSSIKYAALRAKYDSSRNVLQQFRTSARETTFMTEAGVLDELQDLRDLYNDLYKRHYRKMAPMAREVPRYDPSKDPENYRASSPLGSGAGGGESGGGGFTGSLQAEIEQSQHQVRHFAMQLVESKGKIQMQQRAMEQMETRLMFAEDAQFNGGFADALKLRTLEDQMRHVIHHGKLADPVGLKNRIEQLQDALENSRMLQDRSREEIAELTAKLAHTEAELAARARVDPEDLCDVGVWAVPEPTANLDVYDVLRKCLYEMESSGRFDPQQQQQQQQQQQVTRGGSDVGGGLVNKTESIESAAAAAATAASSEVQASLAFLKAMTRVVDVIQCADSMENAMHEVEECALGIGSSSGVGNAVVATRRFGSPFAAPLAVVATAAVSSSSSSASSEEPPPPPPPPRTPTPPPTPIEYADANVATDPPPELEDRAEGTEQVYLDDRSTMTEPLKTRNQPTSTDPTPVAEAFTQVVIPKRDVLLQVNRQPPRCDLALQTKILPPTRDVMMATDSKPLRDVVLQTDPEPVTPTVDYGIQVAAKTQESEMQTDEIPEPPPPPPAPPETDDANVQTDDVVITATLGGVDLGLGGVPTTPHDEIDSASNRDSSRHSFSRPASAIRKFSRPSSADNMHQLPHSIPSLHVAPLGGSRPSSAAVLADDTHRSSVILQGRHSDSDAGARHNDDEEEQDLDDTAISGGVASSSAAAQDLELVNVAASLLRADGGVMLDPTAPGFDAASAASGGGSPLCGSLSYAASGGFGSLHGSAAGASGFLSDEERDDHERAAAMDDAERQRQRENESQHQNERDRRIEQSVNLRLRLTQNALAAAEQRASAANERYQLLRHALANIFQLTARDVTDNEIVTMTAEISEAPGTGTCATLEQVKKRATASSNQYRLKLQKAIVNAAKYKSFGDYVTEYQQKRAETDMNDEELRRPFAFAYNAMSRRLPGEPREVMTPSPHKADAASFASWHSATEVFENGLAALRKSRGRPV